MLLKTFVRFSLHISPLLPLFYGKYLLCIILILLVCLFYIKTFKLESQISHLEHMPNKEADKIASLTKTKNFWLSLTFLKRS